MNTPSATIAAGDPAAPVASAAARWGTQLSTLVRRELWEHRALWFVPLATAVLLALCAIPGSHAEIDIDGAHGPWLSRAFGTPPGVALFTIAQWAVTVPLYLVALVVLAFYLLDCLYAERKDRSILFWKSLPVSDGLTVISKTLIALLIVPIGVFMLAMATGLAFTGIWNVKVAVGHAHAALNWDTLEWLRAELVVLLSVVLAILWYAPVAGYLLLVSAWARRMPFVWANLVIIVPSVLEWFAFRKSFVFDFVAYRLGGIWHTLTLGGGHSHLVTPEGLRPFGTLLEDLNFRGAFTDIDLWLGVAATAAMVWGAARLRRYRDDT
jgi:ABC-2 type transport system permease protein